MKNIKDFLLSQRFHPEVGGSIRWLKELYSRWPTPVIGLSHDYGQDEQNILENIQLKREDILLKDWGLDSLHSISRYLKMRGILKRQLESEKSLRVHCAKLIPEAFVASSLKPFYRDKIKIISYAHGEEITACERSFQLKKMLHFSAKNTSLIIANSKNTASLLSPYADESKISLIHPGVDFNSFKNAKSLGEEWRSRKQISKDKTVILFLGRLIARKNAGALICALKNLPKNTILIIAGEGEESRSLESQAKELNVYERVHFIGAIRDEELAAVYGASDIFSMPSIQRKDEIEGFGIVFLEAAASALCAVSGNCGGQKEAVIDGKTGFVIDGEKQEELEQALEKLISQPELRKAMSSAAKKHAPEARLELRT